jgi:hypothetical protein
MAIDLAKCRKLSGMRMDQGLHIACKALWAVLAVSLATEPGWLH